MKRSVSILSLAALIFLASCGGDKESEAQSLNDLQRRKKELTSELKEVEQKISQLTANDGANSKAPLVSFIQAEEEAFDHYIELLGSVNTKRNILIFPEVAGVLFKIHVYEGQYVKEGQLLAEIASSGLENELASLKARRDFAKQNFQKQSKLWEQNVGTEIQYLQAKSEYESVENSVVRMEEQLKKYKILAPFSGVVDDRLKEQGTVVAPGPGSEIFRLVNLNSMYVETLVPEQYIPQIKKGKKVEVKFPVLNKSQQSEVRQTGNFINPDNRSFSVEIPVTNIEGMVKPNMIAKVLINDYSNQSAILIPQSIVSENAAGEQYVFVLGRLNKKAMAVTSKRVIETGKTKGDMLEVLGGLSPGERVVDEGARSVKEGQSVKVISK